MKEVIAVVRINMMNQTKQALSDAGVDAYFAREAQGRGKGFANPKVLEGLMRDTKKRLPCWEKRENSIPSEC